MADSRKEYQNFAEKLTEGIYAIKKKEKRTIKAIQDELGAMIGPGTMIEFWRKGIKLPKETEYIEILAREIFHRSDLDGKWLQGFLEASGQLDIYPRLCRELNLDSSFFDSQESSLLRVENVPNLPRCIGRKKEINEIKMILFRSDSRLVSLLGSSGVGKTHVAVTAIENCLDIYPDGIYFVPLAGIEEANLLATEIANVLKIDLRKDSNLHSMLFNHLRDRKTLIVLDNFEHLLDAKSFLSRLLQETIHLKLLVTSQERLKLDEEHVYLIEPFDVPSDEHKQRIDEYPIGEMFLQCAQKVRSDFRMAKEDKPFVFQICSLMGGLPLGIKLAAGLIRTHSCKEIVDGFTQDPDFLTTHLDNLPERHRSLRMAFEYAWKYLTTDEKDAYCRLAVFRGGFTRFAAEEVGVELLHLDSLTDKSWLSFDLGERFYMHETMRQLGIQRFSSETDENDARRKHNQFYINFLLERKQGIEAGQPEVYQELNQEIENLRASWQWFLGHGCAKMFNDSLEILALFYGRQYRYQDCINLYQQALQSESNIFNSDVTNISERDHQRALWNYALGNAYYQSGLLPQCREALKDAITVFDKPLPNTRSITMSLGIECLRQVAYRIFPRHWIPKDNSSDDLKISAYIYERLVQIYYFEQELLLAVYSSLRGLNIAEISGDKSALARLLANTYPALATVPYFQVFAQKYKNLALNIIERMNDDPKTKAWVWEVLAIPEIGMGQWEEAKEYLQCAVNIFNAQGLPRHKEECIVFQALCAQYQGQFIDAIHLWREMRRSALRRGDFQAHMWGINGEIDNSIHLGQEIDIPSLVSELRKSERDQFNANTSRVQNVLKLLNISIDRYIESNERVAIITAYGMSGILHLREKHYPDALDCARKAAELIAKGPPTSVTNIDGYSATAEIFLKTWEQDKSDSDIYSSIPIQAKQACKDMILFSRCFPMAQSRSMVWQGLNHWIAGNHKKAKQKWTAGIKLAKEGHLPYDQALNHYEIGRHMPIESEERQFHLNESKKICKKLNISYLLRQIESEIDKSAPGVIG